MSRLRLAIAAVLAACLIVLPTAGSAAPAPDPLLGTWHKRKGEIKFTQNGANLRGTTLTQLKLSKCTYAAGTRVVTLKKAPRGPAGVYYGTHTGDVTGGPCSSGTGDAYAHLTTNAKGLKVVKLNLYPPDGSRRKRSYTLRKGPAN